ncbi:MAG: class I SAM-dependent methyltransferase [Opitutaceae bacterium]|nr:class I SAM-dependent methyltransferase [Verrucomicrobiales bacterium]
MQVSACIACGSTQFEVPETESPRIIDTVGGRDFVQPAYQVRCCRNCGLYYKTAILSDQEFGEYYNRVDFRMWETRGYFPTERAALKFLKGLPHRSRLLDFGCSTGRLLSGLAKEYECHGFEINADAAQIAADKGLRMWSESELAAATNAFDAVIVSDVFEHLTKPVEVLRGLCRSLNKNGHLVLITGNADAPVCRRNPAMFWYFRLVPHVCMLSRRHARYLEDTLGLRLTGWQKLCHYDVGFSTQMRARARDWAYRCSRPETPAWLRGLLDCLPVFRKARHWPQPPGLTCTRDHVLAVFQKQ